MLGGIFELLLWILGDIIFLGVVQFPGYLFGRYLLRFELRPDDATGLRSTLLGLTLWAAAIAAVVGISHTELFC